MAICSVIMAGGSGTRLWPLSRAAFPKQFLRLYGEDTMLQMTLKRVSGLDIQSSIVICNESHRFLVAEQLREIDQSGTIIIEPVARNTAPAIALAALSAKDDPLLLVLSSDHVIQDVAAFNQAVKSAIPLAESGKIVTFGIVPNAPKTEYGYIKMGSRNQVGFTVDKFVEKPVLELAQEYVSSGDYLWNSGMFLFRASKYLDELKRFSPDIFEVCISSMESAQVDLDFLRIDKCKFELSPIESVDYAVMEKTEDAVIVPLDAGWSDVGSWDSLWEISSKDANGNASNGNVLLHKTNNCYIKSDGVLTSAIGVDDLVIVATKDTLMVAHRDTVRDVKAITEQLKKEERIEWEFHREVYRPWGMYESIYSGETHQVKRIRVKPGEKLSLQKHRYRAEHWVVVSGTALVTNGNETFSLSENESTYIPIGVVHALENPGKSNLEIIEVQLGSYLGEDDIVRFEDRYGRV